MRSMRFKQFEIRQYTHFYIPSMEDEYKHHFEILKWAYDNSHCWVIGFLKWNKKEFGFDFESVGTRYLEDREDGLEEWLLKWCEWKTIEYKYEEYEE